MQKKIIIGGIGVIIILAAILTVLNTSMRGMQNYGAGTFSGGMTAPGSTGLPGRPLGMPTLKSGGIARENIEAPMTADIATNDTVDKKVIKNGNLVLNVSSVDRASQDISDIAKNNGGDIFSSNIYNHNNIKSGSITVKVPVVNFEKTVSAIKKVAVVVVQESTAGQDVTSEYVDLQAQLKNKQSEEQQYQSILQQAQKIQDILDVTQQLSAVRGEIEQLQGQLKYLSSQTDMASIFVNLSEDQSITVSSTWRPWQVVKDAVNSLITKMQGFINFLIVLIITVIPVAILYLVLVYAIYWIGRKIYFKIKNKQQ